MSYCRFNKGESDVYVYASGAGGMTVLVSKELPESERPEDRYRLSRRACLEYLIGLRQRGLQVPERALDRLRTELKEIV